MSRRILDVVDMMCRISSIISAFLPADPTAMVIPRQDFVAD